MHAATTHSDQTHVHLHVLLSQVLVQPAGVDQGSSSMYKVHSPHFIVPCLVPLLQYTFKVRGQWTVCSSQAVASLASSHTLRCHPCMPPLSLLHECLQADVTCTQPDQGGSGSIKVLVIGPEQHGSAAPLMTANVKMPLSEPEDC